MAKQADKPRIVATDIKGNSAKLRAGKIEVDFGAGRRLFLSFPDTDSDGIDIEAVADGDGAAPALSVLPRTGNAISLRMEGGCTGTADSGEIAVTLGPMLNLAVQKAVEGADRDNAPKKHQIRRWAQAALLNNVEVTVRLVGEVEGRALNKNYRGKDYATNVLTFAYGGKKDVKTETAEKRDPMIGDLVLCVPVVVREAGEQGKALDAHFAHLVVHGMLHLQGFDHKKKADAAEMEAREREILGALGYADPYVV
ncbi:MAG: rRNA maturation RNase YbeY [Azoarcus sp.]|jgi:probable rRNA maturation factor|nr:rRNA maturation RNase YbeY [Azoarcus sp.]